MKKLYFLFFLLFIISCSSEPVEETGNTKEIDVDTFNWDFEPSEIRVKQGDKVILNFISLDDGVDGTGHGVAIPAFGYSSGAFHDGETATAEFIADKKGTFPFFCSVWCGQGHGDMKGKLIVE